MPQNLKLPRPVMKLSYALRLAMAALEDQKSSEYHTWMDNGTGRTPPDSSEYDEAIEILKNIILNDDIVK